MLHVRPGQCLAVPRGPDRQRTAGPPSSPPPASPSPPDWASALAGPGKRAAVRLVREAADKHLSPHRSTAVEVVGLTASVNAPHRRRCFPTKTEPRKSCPPQTSGGGGRNLLDQAKKTVSPCFVLPSNSYSAGRKEAERDCGQPLAGGWLWIRRRFRCEMGPKATVNWKQYEDGELCATL